MPDVKAIAFYLPQYHPIPENDRWWGRGFTEWVNVTRARPLFPGHHQPRLPADLGFYDLRVPEVRDEQAALARRYGLHGFCYYHYWFNGHRLLERPLDEVLRTGRPDFPFCICWANENWTRRWDGADHEILIRQEYSRESDRRFMEDALPILADPRYIRVRGAALLLVYRAAVLPEPRATTETWRDVARRRGVGEIHLAAVQSFGLGDPTPLGFDSAVEFPPHVELPAPIAARVPGLDPRFRGHVYDYEEVSRLALAKPPPPYLRFRGVMTSWDNTARRGLRAHVFHGASPRAYEDWLRAAVEKTRAMPPEERIVFVNAWNEWAEGAHLEPDQRNGHALLEATARALGVAVEPRVGASLHWDPDEAEEPGLPADGADGELAAFTSVRPRALDGIRIARRGRMHLDRADAAVMPNGVALRRGEPVSLAGWAFAPDVESGLPGSHSFLVLRSPLGRTYYAPVARRLEREDVANHVAGIDRRFTVRAGFETSVSVDDVAPGRYRLGVVIARDSRARIAYCRNRVVVR